MFVSQDWKLMRIFVNLILQTNLYLKKNHYILTMNLKFATLALAGVVACNTSLQAKNYLITSDATAAGAIITHNGSKYTVGTDAFASLGDLMAAGPEESSTVYFTAGTFEGGTITVKGLSLLGCNANQDPRAAARTEVTEITSGITINADDVTINGFNFTGNASVSNFTATAAAPLSGLTYIFNVSSGATLARSSSTAVVKLGKPVSDAKATTSESQGKYKNVTISHNIFKESEISNYVAIAGGNDGITIYDNNFDRGATSIKLDNCAGLIKLKYNNFNEVGVPTESLGGDFCMMLQRCAQSGTTEFEITHNYFNNCIGQKSLYPLIRFYPGEVDAVGTVTPVNCTVGLKHNVFRKKRQVHNTYNYLYYANQNSAEPVSHDVRYNDCDSTNYAFGIFKNKGAAAQERYYADNFDLINTSNCTFGTYKAAYTTKAVTIIQSFDVDPVTGDVYYIQIENASLCTGLKSTYGDPKALCVTRYDKSANSSAKMQLVWAGHGTNMSVGRIDGKVYIFTGGRGVLNSDETETTSTACCWFPWVSGAVVDMRKTSFTHNGKTYPIYTFDIDGKKGEYPAVDEVSRHFVSRYPSGSKNVYAIYDLDNVISNQSKATPRKVVTLTKGDNPTSTSGDNGYNTWAHQGYAISGDYLYMLEGVSSENSTAINKKSTIALHVYNWRTNTFAYRKVLTASNTTLSGNTFGEPEGVSVRRNSSGHAELLFGVAIGNTGARKAVIYKYTPKEAAMPLTKAVVTPSQTSLSLSTINNAPISQTIETTNVNLHGGVIAVISGDDAKNFSVTRTNSSSWHENTTLTVTYTPTEWQAEAKAYMRLSSPMANDVIIPLEGVNKDTLGVNSISADDEDRAPEVTVNGDELSVEGATSINLYTTTGALAASTAGSSINTSGLSGLYIVKAITPGGGAKTAKVSIR